MEMLTDAQISQAGLAHWRKLGQGLHSRYVIPGFRDGSAFVAAIGEAGAEVGHYPRLTMGEGFIDLKLISEDAVYRDGSGSDHVVEWVTHRDLALAKKITEIATDLELHPDPESITTIELALDTADAAAIAPMWAALLTGSLFSTPSSSIYCL